jgi:antitoxin component YwqK of YwqJK toxin-antitoxin module
MKYFILICFLSISIWGSAQRHIKQTYLGSNLKGKVKSVIEDDYNGSSTDLHKDSLNYKCKFEYNRKRQCVKFSVYTPNGKRLMRSYYDDKGRRINLDSSGKPEGKYVDSYDSNHKLTEKYYEHRELMSSTIYDNKGNISHATTYNSAGQIMTRTTFLYDINNNPIQEDETSLNGDGYTSKISRKFDNRHNLTEKE